MPLAAYPIDVASRGEVHAPPAWYSAAVVAVPTKQLVRQVLDELPDDCTIEDVQYRLHVLDAVARGRADVAAERIRRHDEVVAELGRRWGKNHEP
jgi:hypothetical protein